MPSLEFTSYSKCIFKIINTFPFNLIKYHRTNFMCSVSCCIAEKGENLVALGIFNGTSFSKGEGAFVSLARATLQTSPLDLA